MKASLEGISELGINPKHGFNIMVKCTKCREPRGPIHLDPVLSFSRIRELNLIIGELG